MTNDNAAIDACLSTRDYLNQTKALCDSSDHRTRAFSSKGLLLNLPLYIYLYVVSTRMWPRLVMNDSVVDTIYATRTVGNPFAEHPSATTPYIASATPIAPVRA